MLMMVHNFDYEAHYNFYLFCRYLRSYDYDKRAVILSISPKTKFITVMTSAIVFQNVNYLAFPFFFKYL